MLEAASLFTDGCVLCREKEIRIFGRGENGRTVTGRLEDAAGGLLAVHCSGDDRREDAAGPARRAGRRTAAGYRRADRDHDF